MFVDASFVASATIYICDRNQERKIVFPLKAGAHFPRFIIKHRNTEDIEEVKEVLNAFEKDALLLTLIPIAFDIDLETQVQVNSLFVDQENSLSTIWDFILISFRHYRIPTGLHKSTHDVFLQLDSYYLDHAMLLIENYENIIDIFIHCMNRNDNLREARKLEQSNPDDNTNRTDMDVVMDDTTVPGALRHKGVPLLVTSPSRTQKFYLCHVLEHDIPECRDCSSPLPQNIIF